MNTVDKIIGVMDPNAFAFRETIEKLIAFVDLEVEYKGERHRVRTERIKNRPYDTLKADAPCHAVINRGAHWNPHRNSYFQRLSHKTYLLNDMNSFMAINKNTSYGQMSELGMKIPPTYAIPQEDNSEIEYSSSISQDLVFPDYEMFDLKEIGEKVGYPAYLKPQDGGGWIGVQKVNNYEELVKAYKRSGPKPQNLQKSVENYKEFVRCVGMGPLVVPMHYNAKATFSHDRYMRSKERPIEPNFLAEDKALEAVRMCKIINAFYGWDHNSCECLMDQQENVFLIDFANAYPDSSLVSLHYYFPSIVVNTVKWLSFIVCSNRKKRIFGYDWPEYFALRDECIENNYEYEKVLELFEGLADKHFDTKNFNEFVENCLGDDFKRKCHEFFASAEFMKILEEEVRRYFKIESEQVGKVLKYKEIHNLWLSENSVSS